MSALQDALSRSDLLAEVRRALATRELEAWVVGGTVRDAVLGRSLGDIDIAVAGSAKDAARALAAALGGSPFELSGEHSTWRVSGPGKAWTVDLAELRDPAGIEADLGLRDFSVNAIAVPLQGGEAIDPAGGIGDLGSGLLRATSESSFDDDPLRIMRLARFGAELGLDPDQRTIELARESAGRADEPAGERRFAELRGMVCGPDALRALELLEMTGATAIVLPQLDALRSVSQSANHHLDVYEHTLEVLRRWLEVERDLEAYAGDEAEAVAAALAEPLADEMTRRDGIRFACLLHDIGKPATRTEAGGFVSFRGHDSVGAEMIAEFCRELRTSRRFCDYLTALARHHLALGFMVVERPLGRRRIWDYISDCGSEALDVTLLTIADRLSAQGSGVPGEAIEGHLDLAREMLGEILAYERQPATEPLLSGTEIATVLGLEPGPRIGAAVAELRAARFAGEVGDREAAEQHLRAWQERSQQVE